MKYLKFFNEMNEKVFFFDKDKRWFSTSDGLDSIGDHNRRFGNDISFSVDGVEGTFKSKREYDEHMKKLSDDLSKNGKNMFDGADEAKKRVIQKRKMRVLSRKYFDYRFENKYPTFEQIEKYFSKESVREFIQNRCEDEIGVLDDLFNYLNNNLQTEYNSYIF
jgi:hypothetical protein